MSYAFRISGIEWNNPQCGDLPEEAVVWLPNWLVHSDTIDDDEWDEMINEQLLEQFGHTACSFGFEPDEEEDEGEGEDVRAPWSDGGQSGFKPEEAE